MVAEDLILGNQYDIMAQKRDPDPFRMVLRAGKEEARGDCSEVKFLLHDLVDL